MPPAMVAAAFEGGEAHGAIAQPLDSDAHRVDQRLLAPLYDSRRAYAQADGPSGVFGVRAASSAPPHEQEEVHIPASRLAERREMRRRLMDLELRAERNVQRVAAKAALRAERARIAAEAAMARQAAGNTSEDGRGGGSTDASAKRGFRSGGGGGWSGVPRVASGGAFSIGGTGGWYEPPTAPQEEDDRGGGPGAPEAAGSSLHSSLHADDVPSDSAPSAADDVEAAKEAAAAALAGVAEAVAEASKAAEEYDEDAQLEYGLALDVSSPPSPTKAMAPVLPTVAEEAPVVDFGLASHPEEPMADAAPASDPEAHREEEDADPSSSPFVVDPEAAAKAAAAALAGVAEAVAEAEAEGTA